MTSASLPMDKAAKTAYKDAAVEVAKGIAMGAVPILGQAIDAYDTIESCIVLYNAETPDAKEQAEFDLVLALIGWIPGPGDGVKRSFRLVNREPERYAPVLFDLLRFILSECGVKTSPEALLSEIFNASALTAEIDEVIKGIKGSSAYKALPNWTQSTIITVLAGARDGMPRLVSVVEKRLVKWKRMQRNNSAQAVPSAKPAAQAKPESKDKVVAADGKDAPDTSRTNDSARSRVGQQSLEELTNAALGVSGEHIADYICAYEFGWGMDWDGHDKGSEGVWVKGKPNATKMGKISKGGFPKADGVLYKLTDPANGTGIDAIWCANPENNANKQFAIVEAKASRDEDGPKFARTHPAKRNPSVVSKLGVSGLGDPSEILEPIEGNESTQQGTGSKAPVRQRQRRGNNNAPVKAPANKTQKTVGGILVQMSREWITSCLRSGVKNKSLRHKIMMSYARHLFFAPIYHASGSPMAHAQAILKQSPHEEHMEHVAFHYNESDVMKAVNAKKTALEKKHGEHKNLKQEKAR